MYYSCCQTSRNLQNNILLLKDAGVLVVDTYPPELYLIYEDCQSNLAKFITSNPLVKEMGQRRKQEKEFYELGVQIVQAIHHLHSRGVCHGNLNPDNILVSLSLSLSLHVMVRVGHSFFYFSFYRPSRPNVLKIEKRHFFFIFFCIFFRLIQYWSSIIFSLFCLFYFSQVD